MTSKVIYKGDLRTEAIHIRSGNTIITEADDAYVFEVTMEGEVVWTYSHPGNNVMIARCTKYDLLNLGGDYINYGDVNSDNIINVLDAIQLVNFILGNSTPNNDQLVLADLNQDSLINVTDIILLVNIILEG